MTTSVVSARDLLCEVLEGLLVHLARTKLGLVGGHTVSHVVRCEKARNRHLASLHTFSQEIGLQLTNLPHKTHSCDREAPLPPVSDVLGKLLGDVIKHAHWALV